MPPRDTYGVVDGNTQPAGSAASPESRGFGNGTVDPAAPSIGYGEGQVDPRLASAAGIGPTLAGSEPAEAAPAEEAPAEAAPAAPAAPSTEITDPSGAPVDITEDTFLQSTGGGVTPCPGAVPGQLGLGNLASGLLGELLSNLPPAAQGLLNATGLTGALAGIAGEIDAQIAGALAEVSGALNQAAGEIFNDISNAVTNIPGLGPAIEGLTGALGDFTGNLQTGFANLDPVLQQGIAGAVNAVGANLNNPILTAGFNTLINPAAARQIIAGTEFLQDPSTQLRQISTAASRITPLVNEAFGSNAFGQLQARAAEASQQLSRAIIPNGSGFGLTLQVPDLNPNFSRVVNGVIQNPDALISQAQTRINQAARNLPTGGLSIRF